MIVLQTYCLLYSEFLSYCNILDIQSNISGSNTFGTIEISSKQGSFEPMRVNYSVRSGGGGGDLIGISFLFSLTWGYVVCSQ